jgi:hypothetical protein
MLVYHLPVSPLRQLLMNLFELISLQRRYTAATGNAGLVGQLFSHDGISDSTGSFYSQMSGSRNDREDV